MSVKRSPRFNSSPRMTRKKSKLSHKRLQTMINQNQGSDSSLENYESVNTDGSDLRMEKERTALLLWVHLLVIESLIVTHRQMNTMKVMKWHMRRWLLCLILNQPPGSEITKTIIQQQMALLHLLPVSQTLHSLLHHQLYTISTSIIAIPIQLQGQMAMKSTSPPSFKVSPNTSQFNLLAKPWYRPNQQMKQVRRSWNQRGGNWYWRIWRNHCFLPLSIFPTLPTWNTVMIWTHWSRIGIIPPISSSKVFLFHWSTGLEYIVGLDLAHGMSSKTIGATGRYSLPHFFLPSEITKIWIWWNIDTLFLPFSPLLQFEDHSWLVSFNSSLLLRSNPINILRIFGTNIQMLLARMGQDPGNVGHGPRFWRLWRTWKRPQIYSTLKGRRQSMQISRFIPHISPIERGQSWCLSRRWFI